VFAGLRVDVIDRSQHHLDGRRRVRYGVILLFRAPRACGTQGGV
jgi:hypothetical protein